MILLIVPCFNEANRLNLPDFEANLKPDLRYLFVDDGSSDGTPEVIKSFIKKNPDQVDLYVCPQNGGKAQAILEAYKNLKSKAYFKDLEWIGFWDADLATPVWEVYNMLMYRQKFYPEARAIFASRLYRLGSQIERSQLRHYLGRGFATVINMVLKIESYDSQCGAKLFSKDICDTAFGEPFISRWIFDVEILLRLEQKNVIEYPLKQWKDIPGSKLKISREMIRVLKDIFRIKKHYL